MERREFLRVSTAALCTFCFGNALPAFATQANGSKDLTEARFYKKNANSATCNLCPEKCVITSAVNGDCKSKRWIDGRLYSLNYGYPCHSKVVTLKSCSLLHYKPGTSAMLIGVPGCTFSCLYCNTADFSQKSAKDFHLKKVSPGQIIENAKKEKVTSIAFGYTEPIAWYEYMYDIAVLAHKNKINTILLSNGYCQEAPLSELLTVIDAAVIDIKATNNTIYKKLTKGSMQSVLRTINMLAESSKHFELSYLLVPGWTDDADNILKMCNWLVENNYKEIPLHFNTFIPAHKLSRLHPLSEEKRKSILKLAQSTGLKYVYLNN